MFNRLVGLSSPRCSGYWRLPMSQTSAIVILLGGRLAIDFANAPSYPGAPDHDLSWEEFVTFLEASRIVSAERGAQLLTLSQTDPKAAFVALSRAVRLRCVAECLWSNGKKRASSTPVG